MENGMKLAVDQMKQREEAGLNYIYSQTYNFVYLRAKSILKHEEEVKQLMQTVYVELYQSASEIYLENLYEWLGKHVYRIGCERFKKRKEREASFLEMEDEEIHPKRREHLDEKADAVCKTLEHLPDLYQATLFAFYYDYLKIDEIAQLMDCSPDVIMNRLNYTRKYFKRAIENEREENEGRKEKPDDFSVEAVCLGLRKWAVEHCFGITSAQNVYYNICKALGLQGHSISLNGKEFAGVKKTVVYYKPDDWNPIQEEIIAHMKKRSVDKRMIAYIAGGVALLAVVIAVIAFAVTRPEKKTQTDKPKVTDSQDKTEKKPKKQKEEPADEPKDEPVTEPAEEPKNEPDTQPENEPAAEPAGGEEDAQGEGEYIFPNSGTTELTRDEIQGHTKEELRIARNEIYARHGVIFDVEELDTYFQSKSWYTPTISLREFLDTMELSMVEENNITLISEVESGM